MKNLRYANAAHTVIQAEDDAGTTLNIPLDPGNRHFEMIRAAVEAGKIAAFVPDPLAAEGEKFAAMQKRFWTELAAGAKTPEQIVSDARAELAAAVGKVPA